jgi:hypothetical protein
LRPRTAAGEQGVGVARRCRRAKLWRLGPRLRMGIEGRVTLTSAAQARRFRRRRKQFADGSSGCRLKPLLERLVPDA